MSIADYTPATYSLALASGNVITLHPLSVEDVARIFHVFGTEARELFELAHADPFTHAELQQCLDILCQCGPQLAGMVIALSVREPDAIDQARRLPAPVAMLCVVHALKLWLDGSSFEHLAGMVRDFSADSSRMLAAIRTTAQE